MAGYRQHISVSGMLGAGYGAAAVYLFGFTPVQGALAGVLTWIAGMLPDLDSGTGKPVREIFGLLAAVAPFAMMGFLLEWSQSSEGAMLLAVLLYVAIRYGGAFLLGKLCVHRGMFHSVPALFIAAELAFLGYKSDSIPVKLLMAGGVGLGFLSHLLLDEIYAVEWTGIRLRLNKAAGSAMKLVGRRFLPNVFTYALLGVLTYSTLIGIGVIREKRAPEKKTTPVIEQQATEKPVRLR
ncbi:MAG: metal-dependent hydrolase [Planctomycetes bacterium]|nr:metal-dependent hydrolase [Planctomycetota bacterium]